MLIPSFFSISSLIHTQLTHDSPKAQKYLLGGFEQLCGLYQDTLMPKVPVILKAMYDLDFLEEEVILAWAKKVSFFTVVPIPHPKLFFLF